MNFHSVDQRSEAWHELRRHRVTGSEIAAILRNPDKALREHVRKALGLPGFQGNDATRYGTEAEPFAREWYEEHSGLPVRQVGFVTGEDDRLGCSPDGIVDNGGESWVVEFKCPYSGDLPVEPKPDHVAQVRWNAAICGVKCGVLVYWTPDGAVAFPVADNPAWFEQAKAAALDLLFKAAIILRDPAQGLQWLTSQEAEIGFRSDAAWQAAAQAYLEAKDALEAAEAAAEGAKAALLALAGDKPAAGAGVRVAWVERQGSVDWPKIAKAHAIPAEEIEAARKKATRYARVTED